MKNSLFIAFIFLSISIFGQSTSPEELNFSSPASGSQTFTISCAASCTWLINPPAWVTVDQYTGTGPATITVNVEDNPSSSSSRSEEISIMIQLTSTQVWDYVMINQTAHVVPSITLSTNTINAISNDEDKTIQDLTLNSTVDWTASVVDSWIELLNNDELISSGTSGSYNLQVRIFPNPTFSPRTGTITFTGSGGVTQTLTVNQDAASPYIKFYHWDGSNFIPFTQDTLEFPWQYSGSSETDYNRIYVTNNFNWDYSLTDDSWIAITESSLSGSTTSYWDQTSRLNSYIVISPSDNNTGEKRTATLTFHDPTGTITYTKAIVIKQTPENIVSSISNPFVEDINVFPNPTKDNITISSEKAIKIRVYNSNGRVILVEDPKEKHSFDLEQGIYILEIEDNKGKRIVKKIICE